MFNYHNSIALIEDYLNLNNIEYQAHGDRIEIYLFDKNQVSIKFSDKYIVINCKEEEYQFDKVNNDFFTKLKKLII